MNALNVREGDVRILIMSLEERSFDLSTNCILYTIHLFMYEFMKLAETSPKGHLPVVYESLVFD